VNDEFGREPVSAGDLRSAGLASSQESALVHQFRAGGSMNGAVHAPAAEQRGIGRVDDHVDRQFRYVSLVGSEDGHEKSGIPPERLLKYCISILKVILWQRSEGGKTGETT
jgi:hypothetical protein